MRESIFFSVLVFVLCVFVFPVFGSVIVGNDGLWLGYGNGSYVLLNKGVYDSVNRTDNVWFVDGEVYPVVSSHSITEIVGGVSWARVLALGLLVLGFVFMCFMLVLGRRRRE